MNDPWKRILKVNKIDKFMQAMRGAPVILSDQEKKIVNAMRSCVNSCEGMVIQGVPSQSIPWNKNAWCRCIKCGAYWEVTSKGDIVNRSSWTSMSESHTKVSHNEVDHTEADHVDHAGQAETR